MRHGVNTSLLCANLFWPTTRYGRHLIAHSRRVSADADRVIVHHHFTPGPSAGAPTFVRKQPTIVLMQMVERRYRMKNVVRRVSGLVILLLASGIAALPQGTSALTVPVTGSNGFNGTATINRFVNQGGQIIAIGSVANSTRTAFAGVAWQ